MNFNIFTLKAQESVQKAREVASAFQNQSVENIHILKGILAVDDNEDILFSLRLLLKSHVEKIVTTNVATTIPELLKMKILM